MAIKPEAFIVLDDSLTQTLSMAWTPTAEKIAKKLARAVKADDVSKIDAIIRAVDLAPLVTDNRPFVEFIGKQALLFGASRLAPNLKHSELVKTGGKPEIITAAADQLHTMMGIQSQALRDALYRTVDMELQRQKDQVLVAKADEENDLGQAVWEFVTAAQLVLGAVGTESLAIATSLHTSRLAQYGFCVEAELRGVTTYIINTQLDPRTCAVCELMSGKVFTLDTVYARLDQLIRVTDPTDLKTLAPWPKQDKASMGRMRELSLGELMANNWDVPPFHPRCRCYIDATSEQPNWDVINVSETSAFGALAVA